MYQALYRKYRPKNLEDVCGQETIVKILKNSIKNNEINHAYLFAGPRGTGKTSIAKIFAKIVNCENLKEFIPCDKCKSCTEKNNSDIIEIDAASNNGVDEIRELRNKVNLVPSYGKYKVYIIDEVHMLTVGAFNALLKTLEEPPVHVIFILATTDPQKIPETIISRCQRFDFEKINSEAIVENLAKIAEKEKIKIEKEALYEIARLSDGGMRDSIGMLDQAKAYSEEKITTKDIHDINGTLVDEDLEELLIDVHNKNLESILEKIDNYNEKGKNFAKLTEELIIFIRNIILCEKAPEYFKKNHTNIKIYEELAKKIHEKKLFYYIEMLNKYSLEMKSTNNTKLMFELAFIQMISEENDIEHNIDSEYIAQKAIKEPIIKAKEDKKIEVIEEKEENKEIIKEEMELKESKRKKEDEKKVEQINHIKQIRIDNTLSKFNKKHLSEIKTKLETLNELLINPDYSREAAMLLDGTLKAASDDHLIFVYKNPRTANLFNENLLKIEKTINKILDKKYNLIAADNEEWEIIKDEFNHKKREFSYKDEDFNIEEILKENVGEIETMFEEIIEYK